MSRSNPHEGSPNPAIRWFEWNGEKGEVRYYDKDAKKNVDLGHEFTFILLDELGSVRGWHNASDSGIYSNEVKDSRQERLLVKSFKGGIIAEGVYKDIKAVVNAAGGQFVANCYIAFKHDGELAIGSLRFKGAALAAWMEFRKAQRAQLYKGAVHIHGFTEGKKGKITFRVPVLAMKPITDASNAQAIALDAALQEWFKGYFAKNTGDRADSTPSTPPASDEPPPHTDDDFRPSDYDEEPF